MAFAQIPKDVGFIYALTAKSKTTCFPIFTDFR